MAKNIVTETGGSVWKVLVQEGDEVENGQQLFIMEVMKMEVPYEAPIGGKISALNIAEGDAMEEGQVALVIE